MSEPSLPWEAEEPDCDDWIGIYDAAGHHLAGARTPEIARLIVAASELLEIGRDLSAIFASRVYPEGTPMARLNELIAKIGKGEA